MAQRGRKPGYKMSDEHKASLAEGRNQSRVVREYLDALTAHQPKRGRKRTPESIEKRLGEIDTRLSVEPSSLTRLQMIAERDRLRAELNRLTGNVDLTELEGQFVKVVREYSERKGISYQAWREMGVPPAVLREAGLGRSVAA